MIAPPIAVDLDIGSSDASSAMKTPSTSARPVVTIPMQEAVSRLFTHNTTPAQNGADGAVPSWNVTTLIDVGLPSPQLPAASDDQKRLWIYFGTDAILIGRHRPNQNHESLRRQGTHTRRIHDTWGGDLT